MSWPVQIMLPADTMIHPKIFWIWVLLMVADMGTGYMNAALKGEARSDRFLTGLAKRIYLILMVGLLSLLASLMPTTFSVETALGLITAPNVIVFLAILGELKSLVERAADLGLADHPVIAPVARWLKRESDKGSESKEKADAKQDS